MGRPPDLPEFDGRPTVRIVNTMPEHPKIVGLSDRAFRVFVEVICYCSRQESDGKITKAAMQRNASTKTIKELVTAGLLETIETGYLVHDYLSFNRAASEIQSYRESKSEAGSLGAHKRWHVPTRRWVADCEYCLKEVPSMADA